MTMAQAMGEGLQLMTDTLGARRKVDEKLIRAYMWVVAEDGLQPEDVTKACEWFCRKGEGSFPAGPIFRRRCGDEKYRREIEQKNAEFRAKQEAQTDVFHDEYEETVTREEAHAIITAALSRMDKKFTTLPGEEKPKDMKREIARMQEAQA